MSDPRPEVSIVETIRSDSLRDLSADSVEVLLDSLLQDGPVKDVPVIGTVLKSYGVFKSIKERLFLRKLLNFLAELKLCSPDKRKDLVSRLGIDRGSEYKVGETVLLLMERLDDINKPTIIGKLFSACAEGRISENELFRLCSIVERTYIGDLRALRKIHTGEPFTDSERGSYISVGLMIPKLHGSSSRVSVMVDGYAIRTGDEPVITFELSPSAHVIARVIE